MFECIKADLEKVDNYLAFDLDLDKKLSKEIIKFLNAPSKKIRSKVCILYLRAAKMYLLPEHYELFASVELLHNASLIHDDVIDGGKIRRNLKTLNEKFDGQLAVISGDYLLGVALKKLIKIGSFKILDIFAQTLQTMCKGEVSQYFDKYKKIKINKYLEKSSQKTATLFDTALKSAFILTETEYKSDFAQNFGLAFQIRDDLINVIKKDKTKISDDVKDGIYTAPLILSDNIKTGIEKTQTLLNNYIDNTLKDIEKFESSTYKDALRALLESMRDV